MIYLGACTSVSSASTAVHELLHTFGALAGAAVAVEYAAVFAAIPIAVVVLVRATASVRRFEQARAGAALAEAVDGGR